MPELFGASYRRASHMFLYHCNVGFPVLDEGAVWRMMGEGTYALAMEPSTNRDAGRQDARERGELQWLEPGEDRRYVLEIGALPGMTAIGEFEARVSRLAAPGAARAPGESPSDQKAVSRR